MQKIYSALIVFSLLVLLIACDMPMQTQAPRLVYRDGDAQLPLNIGDAPRNEIIVLENTGGAVESCSSMMLPPGLQAYVLNGTCALRGAPEQITGGSPSVTAIIIGSNAGGSHTVMIRLLIREQQQIIRVESGGTATGSDRNETFMGREGNETINAGGGNDTLIGGEGDDTLDGGAGERDQSLYNPGGFFRISEESPNVYIVQSDHLGRDMLSNIEIIRFTDRRLSNRVHGEVSGVEVMAGTGGSDSIVLNYPEDTPQDNTFIFGTSYSNYSGFEIIDAGEGGTDILSFAGYTQTIRPETLTPYHNFETINLSDNADTIDFRNWNTRLATLENYEITAINGLAENDSFSNFEAADLAINGGDGDDRIGFASRWDIRVNLSGSPFTTSESVTVPQQTRQSQRGSSTVNFGNFTSIERYMFGQSSSSSHIFVSDDSAHSVETNGDEATIHFRGNGGNDVIIVRPNALYHVYDFANETNNNDKIDLSEHYASARLSELGFQRNGDTLVIQDSAGNSLLRLENAFNSAPYNTLSIPAGASSNAGVIQRVILSSFNSSSAGSLNCVDFFTFATANACDLTLAINETLIGTLRADSLYGLDGDDTLEGLENNDTLDGGEGRDTARYSSMGIFTLASVADGSYTVASRELGLDTLRDIEVIQFSGENDRVSGEITGIDVLGGEGNDTLLLNSTENDSYTLGSSYANYSGFEIIDAGGQTSADTLLLGAGDQAYTINAPYNGITYINFEEIDAGAHTTRDTLIFGDGNQQYSIGQPFGSVPVRYSNFEAFNGGAGEDTLSIPDGGFTLETDDYQNFESIVGGAGADTIHVREEVIQVDGGDENDSVMYPSGIYTLGTQATGYTISPLGGTTGTLTNIESIVFSNANDSVSGEISGVTVDFGNGDMDRLLLGDGDSNFTIGSTRYSNYQNYEIIDAGGQARADILVLGAGDQVYTIGSPYSDASGITYENFEEIDGGDDTDTLNFGNGDQQYTVGEPFESVIYRNFETYNGGTGTDTLTLEDVAAPQTYTIGAPYTDVGGVSISYTGFEVIDAGADVDILQFGDDDDDYTIESAFEGVSYNNFESYLGGGGRDTLGLPSGGFTLMGGHLNFEIIEGGSGNDVIHSSIHSDTINGNGGNDSIISGALDQTINGGGDSDEVVYQSEDSFTLGGDSATGYTVRAPFYTDTLLGIEEITLNDNANTVVGEITGITIDFGGDDVGTGDILQLSNTDDDTFTIGTSYSNYMNYDTVNALGGNDTLNFPDSGFNNLAAGISYIGFETLNGGSGDDTINGTNLADTINGGGGRDAIHAGGGNDTINGGDDNDTINGGEGNDTINGGAGNDSINAGDNDDTINGGDDNDTINGGEGNDTINGGAGEDRIDSGGADSVDNVTGGTGNDTFVVNTGTTVIHDFEHGNLFDLRDMLDFATHFPECNPTRTDSFGADIFVTYTITVGSGSSRRDIVNLQLLGLTTVDIPAASVITDPGTNCREP